MKRIAEYTLMLVISLGLWALLWHVTGFLLAPFSAWVRLVVFAAVINPLVIWGGVRALRTIERWRGTP